MNLASKSILSAYFAHPVSEIRLCALLLLIFLVLSICYAQTATIWNGTANTDWYTKNTSATTFYISTAEELAGLSNLVYPTPPNATFENKTIILTADIMLNDTAGWKNWWTNPPANIKSWKPIAEATGSQVARHFQGTFDGNGHIISGIYINAVTTGTDWYKGLFGTVGASGTVKNLGITASYIKGTQQSGGIVGRNLGKVYNSFSVGTMIVSTGSLNAGGLIGINSKELKNCYFAGSVSDVPQIVEIFDEFDTNFVSLSAGGGLVGNKSAGTVTNSYFDKTASIVTTKAIGSDASINYGKTTKEMQHQDFADELNLIAGLSEWNEWEFKGGYPTLKHSIAPSYLKDKFANNDAGTTAEKPYIINTAQHLKNLSELASLINLKGYYFRLGENIALEDTWVPIGPLAKPFNGTFDGNGKTISGISTSQSISYQGLFGYIGSDGTVKNIGVIASNIKGKDYASGIAGYNAGTISNSYSTGNASGTNYIGGIAGYNAGTISDSYSTGNVNGTNYVGGFAGGNAGTINSSYSTGNASGTNYVGGFAGNNAGDIGIAYSTGKVTGTTNVGGFAGSKGESGNIIGAYYQTPNPSDFLAEDKTTEYMKSIDFVNELNNIALILSLKKWAAVPGGYPILSNDPHDNKTIDIASYFESGNGTETNPYLISTPKQLEYLSLLTGTGIEKNFNGKFLKLGDNIALNPSKNFTPIGITAQPFKGTFDGNGYTISGIYINSNILQFTGLFGYVDNGKLKGIKITNSIVKGKYQVGGLVGAIANENSFIESCSFSGTVAGTGNYVGGLVGQAIRTKIKNSYSAGEVNGTGYAVGGLTGYNGGTIENSYSNSNVIGNDIYVGGLVGQNQTESINDKINNSYSTGTVKGNDGVGGLVGYITAVSSFTLNIANSYSTGAVTGNNNVGGLFGVYAGANTQNSYATGNVNGKTGVGGLVGSYNISTNTKNISNSYSAGKVTGETDAGGLIGKKLSGGGATGSYYDSAINSKLTDPDGQGKTTADLKNITAFPNTWDFAVTWDIDDENGKINQGYPYLKGVGEEYLACISKNGVWEGGAGASDGACRLKTAQELCTEQGKTWQNGQCITPVAPSPTPVAPTQTAQQICQANKGIWYKETCYSTQAEVNEAKCYEREGYYWENNNCMNEQTPVQPATVTFGKLIARAAPNAIMLENLPRNAKVEMYNLLGEQIYLGNSGNSKILKIQVQTKGIYLVKINNQTTLKVTVL
jgi:hypothetical protein